MVAKAAGKRQPAPTVADNRTIDLDEVYGAESLNPALERLWAELGVSEAGAVNVYVYLVRDGVEARVWKGTPDEYDLDGIAKRFGSGDYLVRVYTEGESGRMGIRGSKSFSILLDPDDDRRAKAAREAPAAPAAQAPQPALNAAEIARIVVEAVKAAMPPPVSPFAALAELRPLFELMRPAAVATPATSPLNDALQLATTIINVGKGLAPPALPVGDDGRPDTVGIVLSKGFDMVTQAMANQRANVQAGAAHDNPALPAPQQQGDEMKALEAARAAKNRILLEFALERACAAAVAGDDPADYADRVYDDIPDDVLLTMKDDPTWLAQLSQIVPAVGQHAAWFAGVRAGIVAIFNEAQADDASGANDESLTGGGDSVTSASPNSDKAGGGNGPNGALPTG